MTTVVGEVGDVGDVVGGGVALARSLARSINNQPNFEGLRD